MPTPTTIGVWDAGDAFLGTTTTLAGGALQLRGPRPGRLYRRHQVDQFRLRRRARGSSDRAGHRSPIANNNVDGDNNGVAATGGAVAAGTITLSANNEGPSFTPGPGVPGEDTNNTVDFGFVQNEPPVANDDPGLTATEDQDSRYSTELTGNDTDADPGDTITIVSAGNATNGSVSVTAGVVTFTPTANFNGTATFEYTIDDGNGNTDTAVATVTVGAVNDPVSTTAPGDRVA